MTPRAIDTHCHLDDPAFDADRDSVFARARDAGIEGFVLAGVDPGTWERQRRLVLRQRGVIRAAGVHPMVAAKLDAEDLAAALAALRAEFAGDGAARAVGEIGLDARFVPRQTLDHQLEAFRAQVALAHELALPLVLHVLGRGTHTRCLDALRRDGVPRRGGVVHAFSASAEVAAEWATLGFHVGFAGPVARPSAERAHRAAAAVPIGLLLLETDSPDLAPPAPAGSPPGFRRNEPTALLDVAAAVAQIRGLTREAVLEAAAGNAERLFGPIFEDAS
jgi:TatD DNase family protein